MGRWFHWQDNDLILQCRLQPRASADELVGEMDGSLKVRITAPPIDGKANGHLISFLAKTFGVSKSKVTIEKGELGRTKRIRIQTPNKLPAKLNITKP